MTSGPDLTLIGTSPFSCAAGADRHAQRSVVKLASVPINPMRNWDNATADELRAEMMGRIAELRDAGVIDLEALPAPKRRITN
jgi:hypothetical protein